MSGDWRRTLWTLPVTFYIVIIRCTETCDHPVQKNTMWRPHQFVRQWPNISDKNRCKLFIKLGTLQALFTNLSSKIRFNKKWVSARFCWRLWDRPNPVDYFLCCYINGLHRLSRDLCHTCGTKGKFTHAMPCRTPAILRQWRVLRDSPRGSR
jgi:hypothetical protein